MSTKANIIIKDGDKQLYFYRHSDGYPEGTMPSLELFIKWLKEGKIRNNLLQASGWLIMIGALEYGTIPVHKSEKITIYEITKNEVDFESIEAPNDWKVGAFEPTTRIHPDIEYLYIIDLKTKEITISKDML